MPRKKEPIYETEQYAFPSRLRELMKDTETKQKDLAKALGKKPQTVSLYTQGQSFPDVNVLYKIASYFNVSADWLIGRPDSTKTIDVDIQAVRKYTGLSEKAINRLHELSEYIKENPAGFIQNPFDVLLTFDGPEYTLQPDGARVSASKVFSVSLAEYLHERSMEAGPETIAELDDESNAELLSLSEQLATIGYTVVPKQRVTSAILQDACDALKALFTEYCDNMRGAEDDGKH